MAACVRLGKLGKEQAKGDTMSIQHNMYNKTQLHPNKEFERHIFHRDQFAHYFRWCHVMKLLRPEHAVLDIGCGSGNLIKMLYHNRRKPRIYLGIDVRELQIKKNKEEWEHDLSINFMAEDFAVRFPDVIYDEGKHLGFDFVVCFEVIEHIGKENAQNLLNNLKGCMGDDTTLLLSTPCYDEKVGAADNHMIAQQIGEFTYDEMEKLIDANFSIIERYGTFASIKDYIGVMEDWQMKMFNALRSYYDVNMLSNIMAPMFPRYSRNVIWILKKRTR